MKPVEIRELSSDDLNVKLKEARAELFNLRFQMATSQLDKKTRSVQSKNTGLFTRSSQSVHIKKERS